MTARDDLVAKAAEALREHAYVGYGVCLCGWDKGVDTYDHRGHLAAAVVDALTPTGEISVEWAVVDGDRVIHIEGATCPADVMTSAHGHGATRVGVVSRTVTRGAWEVAE